MQDDDVKKYNETNYLVDTLVTKVNDCYRLKRELMEMKQMNACYQQALDAANQALNERTVEYKQVINSKSWKVTSGCRNIYSKLKIVRGKSFHIKRKCKKIKLFLDFNKGCGVKENFFDVRKKLGFKEAILHTNNILNQLIDGHLVFGDIKISIVMPVYNVNVKWLERAIKSVERQKYQNWELCIVDDASTYVETRNYLKALDNKKIHLLMQEENKGISQATNAAIETSTGDYIILLDNDDELWDNALLECYYEIKNTKADIIYSDQDIVSESGEHFNPLYKPDWSPDLFFCQMYMGHLICFKKELFLSVGGFRSAFDGSQDYDLLLRMCELTSNIKHIAKILYSWRAVDSSTAMNPNAKPYAQIAGIRALQEHFDRVYGDGYAKVDETEQLYVYDVRYNTLNGELVSIIIPTKDHVDDLKMAIDSIQEKTHYRNFEIIILDNQSEESETFRYFESLVKGYTNIQIIKADCEFNWSKINNIGIKAAKGQVLLFLNNDVKIIQSDWLERLSEQALRRDVGVVGGMLLYEDGTIQHGGVVVGYGDYADHVFKGMKPEHIGTPFVSPLVNRNVLAVTGACMAISRKTIETIGTFNENYIICGSDVELCIRAHAKGYLNVYTPFVSLYHYESKSRGSFVPDNDLYLSNHLYKEFLDNGDPFYNSNLSYKSCIPQPVTTYKSLVAEKRTIEVAQPEIVPMQFRKIEYSQKRINIILPSINKADVFGGIATALSFFEELVKVSNWDARIVISDTTPDVDAVKNYTPHYMFCDCEENSTFARQIVPFADKYEKTLPVSNNDYFIFTGWWTAYCVQEEYLNHAKTLGLSQNVFLYLIQDFEPGFYPWSSQYMFAELTYKTRQRQIAIFNSKELEEYVLKRGYNFDKTFVFNPLLNEGLKMKLPQDGEVIRKKKQILVYGRPNTARNAFTLVVEALKKWVAIQSNVQDWTILAAGESFEPVNLGRGQSLVSVGKLSIEEYAKLLKETYAGLSIMVSPHPSYPPLEMSVYGVQVITNMFSNKDLSDFNDNIYSVKDAFPTNIAVCLRDLCSQYKKEYVCKKQNPDYCEVREAFPFMKELFYIIEGEE